MKRDFFVFDTNALLSAFLVKNSICDSALRKATGLGALAISDASLTEFLEVLWRPKFDKYFTPEERLEIVTAVEKYAVRFSASERIAASTDPDDNLFLELAVACNAKCIVSGDSHLRMLNPFRGIPIYGPSEFLRFY